jgi:CRISPR-associated protein Cas2
MFVITYDITEDKNRVKVSKILEDYGNRVQYSVFESDIDRVEAKSLMDLLKTKVNLENDNIKFYFMCTDCERKVKSIGNDKEHILLDSYVV